MGRFAEYQTKRNINELAALCDARGISLKPLVNECYRLMEHTDLTDQEIYNELLGAVGRFAGNLATGGANLLGQAVGGIRRGVGAMANSFGQGYNQQAGGGQQQPAPAANGQAPAANGQAPATNGQAPAAGGKQPAAAAGGDAAKQLQTVQQMLKKMGSDHQQINGLVTQLTQALSKQQAPAQAVKPT